MSSRLNRVMRATTLGAVLAVTALVVPQASVQSTEVALVKVQRGSGVDLSPQVVWILAVGSDARPGEEMTRARGDALQLVGINTRTGAATAIGIPRDSYVDVPGYGSQRINTGLTYGGPQLQARAVQGLVGIEPDYVVVTRFPFFEDMVDDIGGITVRNPRPFYDANLKVQGFSAGRIHLNGYNAMAFSRIRKTLPGGDFERSANQQRTLRGIHGRIRSQASVPGFIESGVLSVMEHMHTDLAPSELFRIAQAVAQVDPARITTCVIQGSTGNAGAASVVFPNRASAQRYGNDARRDATIEYC